MIKSKSIIYGLAFGLFFLAAPHLSFGQKRLQMAFEKMVGSINGRVGVCALNIETGESISFNGDKAFPMQSVYKFPIAMAILARVDEGKLSLDQKILVDPSVYIPKNGHSPIRDQFPDGTHLSVKELLKYNIEESDGTACDVLLQLLGGPEKAAEYIHQLGVQHIAIATTERVQMANDTIQYQNWSTPNAMGRLLKVFYAGDNLSPNSKALLMKFMSVSSPWFDKRIKGLLPPGTKVFHKTGTSNTINGLTRATNDAGIITLPDGNHLALAVFIADAYASQKERESVIAQISRAAYDYFAKSDDGH